MPRQNSPAVLDSGMTFHQGFKQITDNAQHSEDKQQGHQQPDLAFAPGGVMPYQRVNANRSQRSRYTFPRLSPTDIGRKLVFAPGSPGKIHQHLGYSYVSNSS